MYNFTSVNEFMQMDDCFYENNLSSFCVFPTSADVSEKSQNVDTI